MRTLSSALLAAQKRATGRPYVRVELVEKPGAATRLNWERFYQGAEADALNDATMPGDGSLNRIRGSGLVHRQRVTYPGPGSDFSQWSYWGYTASDVAMCSCGNEVLAFFIQDSGWLRRRESVDYGELWGMITSMSYIGASYQDYRVAACHKANGDAIVLYSDVTTLYQRRRIGGSWESPAAWTNSLSYLTGIAVVHYGDWNILVTGIDPVGKPGVWSCTLGDGYSLPSGIWSALKEITFASPGSNIEFHAPSLARPDGLFRAFFVEVYFGSDYYARSYWSHTLPNDAFSVNRWREPVPFNFSSYYGVALTHSGSYAWLCAPNEVWRASLTPSSIELTPDVIELQTVIKPYSGQLKLSLRNDDARYKPGESGHPEPVEGSLVKKGSKVNLYLGYYTSEGSKTSLLSAFWVEGWEHSARPGASTFVLYALDGWSLLARWRARRQYTWSATTNIFSLLRWLFARAGLMFSSYSASGAVVNQYPVFTIHPGESGLTAVRRLLDMVPDVIVFVTSRVPVSGVGGD